METNYFGVIGVFGEALGDFCIFLSDATSSLFGFNFQQSSNG